MQPAVVPREGKKGTVSRVLHVVKEPCCFKPPKFSRRCDLRTHIRPFQTDFSNPAKPLDGIAEFRSSSYPIMREFGCLVLGCS